MSASEYLRRKIDAAPKIIAPRPLGDSSMVTQKRKFAACAGRPVGTRSDGSNVIPSSESVLFARAGCAVCADPPQKIIEVPCCPYPEPTVVPLALQGTMACPCSASPVTAQLADPKCCATPGNSRTLWANDIPSNFVGPIPPCKPHGHCAKAVPEETPCCQNGMSGRDYMYWDTVQIVEQTAQSNPCGTCDNN